MEKHFVTYNQALALKELEFDEPCLAYYEGTDLTHGMLNDIGKHRYLIAPLKSQVFEWFRENHGLWVSFGYDEDESEELYWYVDKILECGIGRLFFHDLIEYYTYEEAESACIDKLIELLQHDK